MSNLVGGVISLTGSAYLQIYVVGGSANGTPVNIGGEPDRVDVPLRADERRRH